MEKHALPYRFIKQDNSYKSIFILVYYRVFMPFVEYFILPFMCNFLHYTIFLLIFRLQTFNY